MNRPRLEMMRIMLERIYHRSWVPSITKSEFNKNEWLSSNLTGPKVIKFDMTHWIYVVPGRESACPIGFACLDYSFNREGLVLHGAIPYYDGYAGFSAVREFFDLPLKVAERLFTKQAYIGTGTKNPGPVAERIQYLLDHGQTAFSEHYNEVDYWATPDE